MAKVVILDDLQETVALLAPPLIGQGHEVLTDVAPIDFERIMRFKPDLITLNLYRSPDAFDRPIRNIEEDVVGFIPLMEMEKYPAISVIPIILLGNCLQEKDVPTTINYDLFLSFPSDVKIYFPKVVEIASTVKSRRKISRYVCPQCGSRLTYTQKRSDDLFCPRCHTAVAIVDTQTCIARTREGNEIPCDLATLRPPHALPSKTGD
jgi:hypothetical protein